MSFDGTLDAQATGNGVPVKIEGTPEYRPGKVGQALLCGEGGTLAYYASAGSVRAAAGTIEMWVCPLDWTGKEDEFHVFFEALNPGWLVFYRYYQGGLLTLMGVDSGHYTAAAGPQINWKPGEWHHLAGTWRARRLEVYVDGQRAGVADAALVPEKLADTFRLGDHPWHVARKRQTLVDEVKLYSAPLDADSIANAAKLQPIQWKPQLIVDAKVDPGKGLMHVKVDAAGLVGELGAGRTARVELLPKGQDKPVSQMGVTAFTADVAGGDLGLKDVPQGAYELRTVLLDANGAEVARTQSPFIKPGPPVWSGNKLGISDKVLPPWTPLVASRDTSLVRCWGRSYEYAELLRQARSGGEDLLSGPMKLEAVVGGKTLEITGSSRVADANDAICTLTGTADNGALRAAVKHVVEFDGFTWTDLSLQAAQPVKVDELRLTWRMPRSQATLMNADAMSWTRNPAGAISAEGWTSPFVPYFWLGNEDRGLGWYAESKQHWVMSQERPTIEVKPEGDEVVVTIRLLAAPTEITGKLDYGFGMMATPVRPYPPDALRWRMTPGVNPTFDIVWPNGNMKWYGHPEPIDPVAFTERVKQAHDRGIKTVPYVNLNYVSAGVPEWVYYGSAWADPHRVVTPSDVAQMGHASMGTCPASRDWQDYILYRINEAVERFGIDGIYIDCWGPSPCQAQGCGYTDAAGKMQPIHPIRAYREIIRRVYTLFHERRPDPLMMVHMSSEVDMPMLSFTDTILDGEQFRPQDIGSDYLNVLPPDKFRAEFLGRNMGPVEFFLPEFRGEDAVAGTPNLAAYLLLHGIQPWPIWSDGKAWNKLFEALDAFGIADAKFLPYWQSRSWAERPPDLVSVYLRDGKALLVDVNTMPVEGQAHLTLDLKRLEMKSLSLATDVFTGEALKLEGNVLTIPQEPHGGRIILLEP